jgi:molybdenum cofactor synthesis domain-containing protein
MPSECVSTACALLIGNELLNGTIDDCNLFVLARTLLSLGIRLKRALVLPDHLETLSQEIRDASQQYDVVFTSGGVGPTHDDVTICAAAQAFGVDTVINEQMRRALVDHYGEPLSEAQTRLALVPEGANMIRLPRTNWPTIVMRNVWLLPGVPNIFQAKLDVVRHFLKGPVTYHSCAVMCRSDELTLKQLIDFTVRANPDVEIGSYPQWPPVDAQTKITFQCTERVPLKRAVDQFISGLPVDDLMSVIE